ncbi:MAG: type II secretion system F family protein [Elusimicrobiota bacterium]|jgi:tight adherence protein B
MTPVKSLWLARAVAGAGAAGLILMITGSAVLAGTFGILGYWAPWIMRRQQKQRDRRLLARQLRLALQTLTHALQVGASFQQALERAAREGEPPLALHWSELLHSLQVGKPLTSALQELPSRVPIQEIRWFVAAVCITQQTGGSLAEVLETLAATLQERQTLFEKVAALTAQGKASGYLLSVLPFLLMAALYLMAPELIVPAMHTLAGQILVAVVVGLVTAGSLIIQRIVTIHVE